MPSEGPVTKEAPSGTSTRPHKASRDRATSGIPLQLTRVELKELMELAHHYESVMGFVRHIVVATSPARIRRRYRFIVLESNGLEAVAENMLERLARGGGDLLDTELALEEAVAFWGRVLSNLRTKRSRRKLSSGQATLREAIEAKLASGVEARWRVGEVSVRESIATRRAREAEWMLATLQR